MKVGDGLALATPLLPALQEIIFLVHATFLI